MIDTLRLPRRGNAHTHGRFFNSLLGAIGQTCDSALYSSDVVQQPSNHVYRRDPIQTLQLGEDIPSTANGSLNEDISFGRHPAPPDFPTPHIGERLDAGLVSRLILIWPKEPCQCTDPVPVWPLESYGMK